MILVIIALIKITIFIHPLLSDHSKSMVALTMVVIVKIFLYGQIGWIRVRKERTQAFRLLSYATA